MVQYFPVVNGYQSFFRDPSTRVYRDGATFEDILALYEFDVELREIMLDALLKVEAKIRSALAYKFCAAYGESQSKYLDARCYATSKGAKRVLPKLLNMLEYISPTRIPAMNTSPTTAGQIRTCRYGSP